MYLYWFYIFVFIRFIVRPYWDHSCNSNWVCVWLFCLSCCYRSMRHTYLPMTSVWRTPVRKSMGSLSPKRPRSVVLHLTPWTVNLWVDQTPTADDPFLPLCQWLRPLTTWTFTNVSFSFSRAQRQLTPMDAVNPVSLIKSQCFNNNIWSFLQSGLCIMCYLWTLNTYSVCVCCRQDTECVWCPV